MESEVKRICLWSGPRNISTALMYSFAQRMDTIVIDEPLYAHYLAHSTAREYHPGSDEILASLENDGSKVIQEMLGNFSKSVVFFKHMTHHLIDLDLNFLKNTINVILTRDPKEMLPSYDKAVKNPNLDDVGYKAHVDLLNHLQSQKLDCHVIDSRKIQDQPEHYLNLLCEKIGIPFQEEMLHWKAGPRIEDGCWAKYWYHNVHKSTHFRKYKPKMDPFPEHLKSLLEECLPYYAELQKVAL